MYVSIKLVKVSSKEFSGIPFLCIGRIQGIHLRHKVLGEGNLFVLVGSIIEVLLIRKSYVSNTFRR